MTNQNMRPKGPQPVLDDLLAVPLDSNLPLPQHRHSSSYQNGHLRDPSPGIARSSTQYLAADAASRRERSASPAADTRPKLLRAKSDFIPRRDHSPRGEDSDSKASGETEWGIRHGFESQLAPEEWNNLISASCHTSSWYRNANTASEFFPLLH